MPTIHFGKPVNPQVPYQGKTIPRDAAPYAPPVPNPNVPYQGKIIPADTVKYVAPKLDYTNLPQLVILSTDPAAISAVNNPTLSVGGLILDSGAIALPADVKIGHDVEKVIADTTIVDGVQVTEHIRRKPYVIEMEFTIRARNGQEWFFGQDFLAALQQKIILPPTVIYVHNTLLNKMNISQLILRKQAGDTIRGSINIPIQLRFTENVVGESLIMSK